MTRWETHLTYQRRLGCTAGARWSYANYADRRGRIEGIALRPKWLRHPVYVRLRGSSDMDVFQNIFIHGELDFWRTRTKDPVKVVMDLGANVGYASAVFLSLFPRAFVLAVEPDPENARLCRRNLAPYGDRARVVEGAVWHTPGMLALSRGSFGDGREWATQVRAAESSECADVAAWDIPSLLAMCPERQIDILKVDIEGSEVELFGQNTDAWLPAVRNICMETHGAECERAVESALTAYRYSRWRTGEYNLHLNLEPYAPVVDTRTSAAPTLP